MTETRTGNRLDQQVIIHQNLTLAILQYIGQPDEPDVVAAAALETIAAHTGWARLSVHLLDQREQPYVLAATETPPSASDLADAAFSSHEVERRPVADAAALAQAVAVPFVYRRRPMGIFLVEQVDEPWLAEADEQMAGIAAAALALALGNAQHVTYLQQQLTVQTALQNASIAIAAAKDLPTLLKQISEQMCRAIDATSAYLCDFDDETLYSTVQADYLSPFASAAERISDLGETYYLPDDFPEDIEYLIQGQPRIIHASDDTVEDPSHQHMTQFDAQSILQIPLQFEGRTIAYAELWESRYRRRFTQEEITLCQSIAQQAAIAIAHTRLFDEIQRQHGRLRALLESTRDGIILVGSNKMLLTVNRQALTLLGIAQEDTDAWLNQPLVDMGTALPPDRQPVNDLFDNMLQQIDENNRQSTNGSLQIGNQALEWLNNPVLAQDRLLGRMLVLRDVTETHLLNQLREDLTHTMVHDLRTPLTAISAALDLLVMYDQHGNQYAAERQSVLAKMRRGADNLLLLVNAILDISRLESKELQLNQEVISLHTLIANVVALNEPLAQEKEITMAYQPPRAPLMAWVDRGIMERVLQNLIGNALRFTPNGGEVQVRAEEQGKQRGRLLITVSDNGPGVPNELRPHLFDKFATGKRAASGSGLGLYFCKIALEAHQGEIWLDPDAATGATFCVSIPQYQG